MEMALEKSGNEFADIIFSETAKIHEILKSGGVFSELPPVHFLSQIGMKPSVPDQRLRLIRDSLLQFRNILERAQLEEIELNSPISFTKYWLQQTGYSCPQDFFEAQPSGEVVIEGYSTEHIQIFRNLAFMKRCGYSLAEIFTYPWPDLFERPQVITQQCLSEVSKAMTLNRTIRSETEVHFMKERYSCDRRIHKVNFQTLAPIRQGSQVVGYFVSATGNILDKPDRHEVRFI